MSRTTDSKKQIILDYINEYYGSYGEIPTVRDIAAGTGIAVLWRQKMKTQLYRRFVLFMKPNVDL